MCYTKFADLKNRTSRSPVCHNFSLLLGLPDENGRLQILEIHTAKLQEAKKLAVDVDLKYLAAETKNFSGAEIEGLVRAATTSSMNQLVKVRTIR